MEKVIQSKNDKTEWLKNNSLTEQQRKELIEDKIKKVYNQQSFNRKVRAIYKND